MGRPARADEAAVERVEVRMSPEEKERLRKLAKRAGLSVSDYVRKTTGVDRAEA